MKKKSKGIAKNKLSKGKNDDKDIEGARGESDEELGHDIEGVEKEVEKLSSIVSGISGEEVMRKIDVKGSKPISQLKKGDKIKVDGINYEVDAHYVLIDHGKAKEMTIEIFNLKTDKDYQLRYFSDQIDTSLEFYELQEILYVRKPCLRVEW